MALPEESLAMQSEDTVLKNTQATYIDSPAKEAAMKATKEELSRREKP